VATAARWRDLVSGVDDGRRLARLSESDRRRSARIGAMVCDLWDIDTSVGMRASIGAQMSAFTASRRCSLPLASREGPIADICVGSVCPFRSQLAPKPSGLSVFSGKLALMFDIDDTIDSFRRGTLDFDCRRMVLAQGKKGGVRFEGQGYIRQSTDGTLVFKIYVTQHDAKSFGHLLGFKSGNPGDGSARITRNCESPCCPQRLLVQPSSVPPRGRPRLGRRPVPQRRFPLGQTLNP
jgi:hypothetical protein